MNRSATIADSATVEVSDDFGAEFAVGIEELEAVEAFLMPFIGKMLEAESQEADRRDSERPQNPALV